MVILRGESEAGHDVKLYYRAKANLWFTEEDKLLGTGRMIVRIADENVMAVLEKAFQEDYAEATVGEDGELLWP